MHIKKMSFFFISPFASNSGTLGKSVYHNFQIERTRQCFSTLILSSLVADVNSLFPKIIKKTINYKSFMVR